MFQLPYSPEAYVKIYKIVKHLAVKNSVDSYK